MNIKPTQKGFTLIELLIVVAIIGILAAIAIPAYSTYTKKAKFSEVVNSVNGVKLAIDVCYAEGNALTACDAVDNNGVDAAEDGATVGQYVASVAVTENTGVITATSTDTDFGLAAGATGYTYILTPVDPGSLLTPAAPVGAFTWTAGGTCGAAGLC
jgi:type IV pilus assembly protein PilA